MARDIGRRIGRLETQMGDSDSAYTFLVFRFPGLSGQHIEPPPETVEKLITDAKSQGKSLVFIRSADDPAGNSPLSL
jgi:hypothetical protein